MESACFAFTILCFKMEVLSTGIRTLLVGKKWRRCPLCISIVVRVSSLFANSIKSFKFQRFSVCLWNNITSRLSATIWLCEKEIGSPSERLVFCFIWSIYQSVINKLVFTMRTSVRYPSISCAYHSGKVSLSPIVNKIAFLSHESK